MKVLNLERQELNDMKGFFLRGGDFSIIEQYDSYINHDRFRVKMGQEKRLIV